MRTGRVTGLADYEICFIGNDGRVALFYVTACNNELDAKAAADRMMRPEFAKVEISRCLDRHSQNVVTGEFD